MPVNFSKEDTTINDYSKEEHNWDGTDVEGSNEHIDNKFNLQVTLFNYII